jgi:hypothetical protein
VADLDDHNVTIETNYLNGVKICFTFRGFRPLRKFGRNLCSIVKPPQEAGQKTPHHDARLMENCRDGALCEM